MIELAPLSIGIGLMVSLLFSEFFGLAAGGMVVPGYVALHLHNPLSVALTLAVGWLTFGLVRGLSRLAIIYGRRRSVLMILIGFVMGASIRHVIPDISTAPSGVGEHVVIGYIIPGLIAIWIDRQGLVETFSTLVTASAVVRLVLIVVLGSDLEPIL